MNRAETIEILRSHAPALREHGIAALYLFGSTARDQAGPDSDVDLFIDIDPAAPLLIDRIAGCPRVPRRSSQAPRRRIPAGGSSPCDPPRRRTNGDPGLLMPRTPLVAPTDIADAIARIEHYTAGLTREAFASDNLHRDAIERCIEIISEASRRLPDELRSRYPAIRWSRIAAIGNVFRHEYDEVSPALV